MENKTLTNYFDKNFELRYFEMNELGFASPTTILTLLEETAAEHCYDINYNLYQLAEQNIGWILFSGIMQIDRYPNYKERITIRTWLSKYSTFKAIRENIIYDAQGDIIGRAKGLWVFFDIDKRTPKPIFDDIKKEWSFCSEESIKYNLSKKIQAIETPDYHCSFKVHKYDADMYKHANNIKYLQWVIDSIPNEITDNYYLYSIDGKFISEVHLGQTIESFVKRDTVENGNKIFLHTIKADNKVCAVAHTVWRKIEK